MGRNLWWRFCCLFFELEFFCPELSHFVLQNHCISLLLLELLFSLSRFNLEFLDFISMIFYFIFVFLEALPDLYIIDILRDN